MLKKMRIIILNSILFCFVLGTKAQSKAEIQEMLPDVRNDSSYCLKEIDNDVSAIKGALYFYKNYVSSQDASQCSFYPSCSEYAVIAIKKQGLIKGLINFSDRFQRCNGKSPEQYELIPGKHLLFDPVRDINYKEL